MLDNGSNCNFLSKSVKITSETIQYYVYTLFTSSKLVIIHDSEVLSTNIICIWLIIINVRNCLNESTDCVLMAWYAVKISTHAFVWNINILKAKPTSSLTELTHSLSFLTCSIFISLITFKYHTKSTLNPYCGCLISIELMCFSDILFNLIEMKIWYWISNLFTTFIIEGSCLYVVFTTVFPACGIYSAYQWFKSLWSLLFCILFIDRILLAY